MFFPAKYSTCLTIEQPLLMNKAIKNPEESVNCRNSSKKILPFRSKALRKMKLTKGLHSSEVSAVCHFPDPFGVCTRSKPYLRHRESYIIARGSTLLKVTLQLGKNWLLPYWTNWGGDKTNIAQMKTSKSESKATSTLSLLFVFLRRL